MRLGGAQCCGEFFRGWFLEIADESVREHVWFLRVCLRFRWLCHGPMGMNDAPAFLLSLVHLGSIPTGGHRPDVPHQDIRQDRSVAAGLHLWVGHLVAVEKR